jgi:hypothetical protein
MIVKVKGRCSSSSRSIFTHPLTAVGELLQCPRRLIRPLRVPLGTRAHLLSGDTQNGHTGQVGACRPFSHIHARSSNHLPPRVESIRSYHCGGTWRNAPCKR